MKLNLASLAGLIVVGAAATYAASPAHAADAGRRGRQVDLRQGARRLRGRPHRRRTARPASRKPARRSRNASATRSTTPARRARTRSSAATWSRPKDKADCLARIEGPSQPNQTTTTSGSVGRRRRDPRDEDDHDRPADDRHPPGDPGGERAALIGARPEGRPAGRARAGGRRCYPRLPVAPWPPSTSPTSSRPSTGGASARPRPTASPPAPRCARWPRCTR